jgi:hypothetical protein
MSDLYQSTAHHNPASDPGTLVIEHWLAGGEILPGQMALPSVWTPEKRLAAAVLRDALLSVRNAGTGKGRHHTVSEDVRWIFSDDTAWPYAFVPLCHLFGIEVAWVRRVVRGWQRQPSERYAPRFRHAA